PCMYIFILLHHKTFKRRLAKKHLLYLKQSPPHQVLYKLLMKRTHPKIFKHSQKKFKIKLMQSSLSLEIKTKFVLPIHWKTDLEKEWLVTITNVHLKKANHMFLVKKEVSGYPFAEKHLL